MDIDDLLAETDDKEGADAVIPEEILPTGGDVPDVENVDITDLIDNMDNTDSDLDEINSLLKKADGSQGVDDDMLALLEGIEEPAGRDDGADDEFDIFADMPTEKNKAVDPPGEEKKAKNKKRPPKGKKKAGKNKGEPEELERETGIQSVFGDEEDDFQGGFGEEKTDDSWGIGEIGQEKAKEKKPGLLARFLEYITQEEEEEEEEY